MKETIKNSNNSITLKEILISEKQFTKTNYKRLQKALVYIQKFNRFWWLYVFNSWLFERNK